MWLIILPNLFAESFIQERRDLSKTIEYLHELVSLIYYMYLCSLSICIYVVSTMYHENKIRPTLL